MHQNVGSTERYVRLATGLAAAAAAARTHGWPRAALATVATAGVATGLTRYCPINEAVGRDASDVAMRPEPAARADEGMRDSELRRQTAMASALGTRPSTASGEPRVTPAGDSFDWSGGSER